ncbi:MAG: hypothetical protein CMJ89_04045 [Planctomycetes bacterium]|nr:hypothetical protein [Planctomycetota bacterium]
MRAEQVIGGSPGLSGELDAVGEVEREPTRVRPDAAVRDGMVLAVPGRGEPDAAISIVVPAVSSGKIRIASTFVPSPGGRSSR